jgi:hypothetical protein
MNPMACDSRENHRVAEEMQAEDQILARTTHLRHVWSVR